MSSLNIPDSEMLDEISAVPIREVVIDGLAAMKIVKHCNENLPSMCAGSLLGVEVNGVLEITYTFSFPVPKSESDPSGDADELDGSEYQMEMMKMLRDVNIDNNCVGWYQSMYLGTICTNDAVGYQYTYQTSEDLSENCIVLMYDPILSRKGNLVLKAYRLSDRFVQLKRERVNQFINPSEILEELPLKIRSVGLSSVFVRCLQDTHKSQFDCDFDSLSLVNGESNLEKHLELLGSWLDDLVQEQQKFQQYSKSIAKPRQEHIRWLMKRIQENMEARENGEDELSTRLEVSGLKPLMDAPPRTEPLLILSQLEKYCNQVNEQVDTSLHKLQITSQLGSAI
eukprot:gene7890-10706_t